MGKLGKKLYLKLGDRTHIVSRKKQEIYDDNVKNFYPLNEENIIQMFNKCNIIINTIPSNVIPEKALNTNNKPYILDIASFPYGINEEIAKKYKDKINYKLYLGIPSVFAPKEASEILLKVINKNIDKSPNF